MVTKHKRCSTSLPIREIQFEPTMRDHFTPTHFISQHMSPHTSNSTKSTPFHI